MLIKKAWIVYSLSGCYHNQPRRPLIKLKKNIEGKSQDENALTENAHHFTDLDKLVKALKQQFTTDVFSGKQALSLVVKGSRSAKMEKVVAAIETWFIEKNIQSGKSTRDAVKVDLSEPSFGRDNQHNNKKETS